MPTLVDSDVLIDVMREDPKWSTWSSTALREAAEQGLLAINPIVYAEVSIGFSRIEDLDEALSPDLFSRLPLPWEAGFLAGKCYVEYRRRSGQRRTPLPDFYIGAHAQIAGLTLLTRDARFYRTYFPKLNLITPPGHPTH